MTAKAKASKPEKPSTAEASASPTAGPPITVEVTVHLKALAIPEADGRYSILIPALPGCYSAADTLDEIEANAVEAAELWLEGAHDDNKDEAIRIASGEAG
jgi:predicted RNase H-like HicB family nuclease